MSEFALRCEVVRGKQFEKPSSSIFFLQNREDDLQIWQDDHTMSNITVIGIGAMGGGMARAMLNSSVTSRVVGYDRSSHLVDAFHQEARAAGKASHSPPTLLKEAVSADTHFVVLALVNESQCQQVCFGMDQDNLLNFLPDGSCVILCSTVTGTCCPPWPQYIIVMHSAAQ